MAVDQGVATIIVTPHQLGSFSHNTGADIRARTAWLQALLDQHNIPLSILAGADVRIEPGMVDQLQDGSVLTLGDHGKHVLLELPHELYIPLEGVLDELAANGIAGILSHPERNEGLLRARDLVEPLVDAGCLMQVTAGSLFGAFGKRSQEMAEWMLRRGLVHFLATDAHGSRSRRPQLRRAFAVVAGSHGDATAQRLCATNPAAVAAGHDVEGGRFSTKTSGFTSWFPWKVAS